jgi:hypothetical protein
MTHIFRCQTQHKNGIGWSLSLYSMGPCILAKGYLLVDAENIFLQAITKFPNWGGASISAVTVCSPVSLVEN